MKQKNIPAILLAIFTVIGCSEKENLQTATIELQGSVLNEDTIQLVQFNVLDYSENSIDSWISGRTNDSRII